MQIPIFASLVLNFNPRPPRGGRLQQPAVDRNHQVFQSTPSARRATALRTPTITTTSDFNPRPPRGGRPDKTACRYGQFYFNPRPPRGGRPGNVPCRRWRSIYFNPRPPRGGRPTYRLQLCGWSLFQSTPSARRATAPFQQADAELKQFQSTPSARRATAKAAKKSTTFVPLYTLVHNLKRNFTKAPAK